MNNGKTTYKELKKKFENLREENDEWKEKELNKEKTLFRTLINNIPDYIYFKDLNSRFILINNSLAKYTTGGPVF